MTSWYYPIFDDILYRTQVRSFSNLLFAVLFSHKNHIDDT